MVGGLEIPDRLQTLVLLGGDRVLLGLAHGGQVRQREEDLELHQIRGVHESCGVDQARDGAQARVLADACWIRRDQQLGDAVRGMRLRKVQVLLFLGGESVGSRERRQRAHPGEHPRRQQPSARRLDAGHVRKSPGGGAQREAGPGQLRFLLPLRLRALRGGAADRDHLQQRLDRARVDHPLHSPTNLIDRVGGEPVLELLPVGLLQLLELLVLLRRHLLLGKRLAMELVHRDGHVHVDVRQAIRQAVARRHHALQASQALESRDAASASRRQLLLHRRLGAEIAQDLHGAVRGHPRLEEPGLRGRLAVGFGIGHLQQLRRRRQEPPGIVVAAV
mmetsp:Transcript_12347/g.45710  ORF Transcript_12347/g.45710 Transcript_12347/m.45710 type:complete len:334 (+) Transcript_12347:594-1595(+)